MKKLFVSFMVLGCLAVAGSASAATLHVATGGNDAADGSLETPKATLRGAFLAATDATNTIYVKSGTIEGSSTRPATVSGRSYLIEGYTTTPGDGGMATLTTAMDYPLYLSAGADTDTFVIKNITIVAYATGNSTGVVYQGGADERSVTIQNCDFSIPAGRSGSLIRSDVATGDARTTWTISDTTLTHNGTGSSAALVRMLGGIGTLTLTGNTIDGNQTSVQGIELAATTTSLFITGENVFTTTGAVFNIGATFESDRVVVQDNTMTSTAAGGFALDQYDVGSSVIFERNTVTTAGAGVRLGTDGLDIVAGGDIDLTEDATGYDPYKYVQINGNTITRTGAGAGHALMVGAAVVGGEVAYNRITGATTDYAMVIKGSNLDIHHNEATGRFPMLVSRGSYHRIKYNSLRSTGASAAFTYGQNNGSGQDLTNPTHAIVTDNIFDGSGSSGTYAFSSSTYGSDNFHRHFVFDRNILIPGASGVAFLNGSARGASGTNAARLAEVQAAWLESFDDVTAVGNTKNDTYSSVETDAGFLDSDSLRIGASSPAKGTKSSVVPNLLLWNDRGAWQTMSVSSDTPYIVETVAVTTPTNDATPSYTFISTAAGDITYGGGCSSATSVADNGTNPIAFSLLDDGTYSNCTIKVTGTGGDDSNTISVTPFVVDTTAPEVTSSSPAEALAYDTTDTTLVVSTDDPATCRYGTVAETAYADLPNTFTTSNNRDHSANVSGLLNGQSYAYYVRCLGTAGNTGATDYTLSFSVSGTQPTSPSGGSTASRRAQLAPQPSSPPQLSTAPATSPAVVSLTPQSQLSRSLRFGDQNEEVRLLQTFLAEDPMVYPEGQVSGYFGPLTQRAVERFQEKYGIVTTPATSGLVGPQTRAKLNELFAAPASMSMPPASPPVTSEVSSLLLRLLELQRELLRLQGQ